MLYRVRNEDEIERTRERAQQPEYVAQIETLMAQLRAFGSPQVVALVDQWEHVREQVLHSGRDLEDRRQPTRLFTLVFMTSFAS